MRKRDFMENIKVGDKLMIRCYKHDGSLEHTSDEAIVLENNDEFLVCGNGRAKITEKDGRSHMTNEPAVLFFYQKHWFIIIGQLKKYGLFYYCNIASPYIIDKFNQTENAEKLKNMGVVLSYICPLMYMNNPLCAKMPVITNSNKLRTYTSSKYYTDSEILEEITGGKC